MWSCLDALITQKLSLELFRGLAPLSQQWMSAPPPAPAPSRPVPCPWHPRAPPQPQTTVHPASLTVGASPPAAAASFSKKSHQPLRATAAAAVSPALSVAPWLRSEPQRCSSHVDRRLRPETRTARKGLAPDLSAGVSMRKVRVRECVFGGGLAQAYGRA